MPTFPIRHVRLVNPEDRAYRQFCRDYTEKRQCLGEKQMPSASIQLSRLIEQSIVSWLKTEFSLLQEKILGFEYQDKLYGYSQKYREIDAISGTVSQPEYFFEIKASVNPHKKLPFARKQLQESLKVADYRWSKVRPCLIYVDTTPPEMLPAFDYQYFSMNFRFCTTLAELREHSDDRLPCIRLLGERVWQQALEANLTIDYDLWERAQVELKQNILARQEREWAKIAGTTDTSSQNNKLPVHMTKTHHVFCSPAAQGKTALEAAFQQAMQQ
jgi:hypothetical protein